MFLVFTRRCVGVQVKLTLDPCEDDVRLFSNQKSNSMLPSAARQQQPEKPVEDYLISPLTELFEEADAQIGLR